MPRRKPGLTLAARRVAYAKRVVADQRQLVATLKASGRPTSAAERALSSYVSSLKHLEDREQGIRQSDEDKMGEIARGPIAVLLVARTEPSPLVGAKLTHITESFYGARARNRASSASNSAMRRSRAASATASKRCGMCCEQFASHAETAKMITRSGRAL
jgi:hypothetical protein